MDRCTKLGKYGINRNVAETSFERPPYLPIKSSLSKEVVSRQESIKHSQIENVPLKVGLSKGEVSGEEVVGGKFYCTTYHIAFSAFCRYLKC